MKKISHIPSFNISNVFDDCLSTMRNGTNKTDYLNAKTLIVNYSNVFYTSQINSVVHTHTVHATVGATNIDKDKMTWLYEQKFSKLNQPSRVYYDSIMQSASNNICPYCGINQVSTLDHFMSKSNYPTLAITPRNLIPSCYDCNRKKGSPIFSSPSDTHIDPYFDDTENDIWLIAGLYINNLEPSFLFKVKQPLSWSVNFFDKVKNHFRLFKLGELYSFNATREFQDIRYHLSSFKVSNRSDLLRDYFHQQYMTCIRFELNSYKSAFYSCCEMNYIDIFNIL